MQTTIPPSVDVSKAYLESRDAIRVGKSLKQAPPLRLRPVFQFKLPPVPPINLRNSERPAPATPTVYGRIKLEQAVFPVRPKIRL